MAAGLDIHHAEYALWKANYDQHAYRHITLDDVSVNKNFDPKGTQPTEAEFPGALKPVDDLPPATIITSAMRQKDGTWLVRGTVEDNGEVKRVLVNGGEARAVTANFAEWEIGIASDVKQVSAYAVDAAGNMEPRPHTVGMP